MSLGEGLQGCSSIWLTAGTICGAQTRQHGKDKTGQVDVEASGCLGTYLGALVVQ